MFNESKSHRTLLYTFDFDTSRAAVVARLGDYPDISSEKYFAVNNQKFDSSAVLNNFTTHFLVLNFEEMSNSIPWFFTIVNLEPEEYPTIHLNVTIEENCPKGCSP